MQTATYKKFLLNKDLLQKSRLLALAGNQTRIRILCFMFEYKKACVSDIAQALNMNIAAISHHLQMMRDNGLFETERMGNKICYILVKNNFTNKLTKVICE